MSQGLWSSAFIFWVSHEILDPELLDPLEDKKLRYFETSENRKTATRRHISEDLNRRLPPPPSLGATELAHFPVAQLHKQKLTGMTSESAGEETCSFTTSDHP